MRQERWIDVLRGVPDWVISAVAAAAIFGVGDWLYMAYRVGCWLLG